MKKYKKNIALIFLAAAMLFYAIPFGVGATGETENAEPQNRYNVTLTDDSPEYVREIAEKSQIYDEFEVVSLREENVKHFALADGTFKAVVYPYIIHEQDEDGKWAEVEEFEGSEIRGNRDLGLHFVDAAGDTYVSSYSPSSNYGSATKLYVGTSTMRTYIVFDNPTIPSNATITYGELDICYWYVSGVTTGYVTVGVYEVESYWNASTLTWNTVQLDLGALASNAIATANLYAGVGITSSNPRDELIDITEAVQDWYAGKTNYGIALEYMGGTNTSVGICSMEDDMYPMYMLYYTLDDLPVENGTYFLYNKQLQRYLQNDPAPNSSYMELWSLDGDADQKWEISYLHNGYYRIKSATSGLSLGIQSGSENTNEARVVQGAYYANASQQWSFSTSSRDNIVIRPRCGESYYTDWAMSAKSGTPNTDGREVVQYAYTNNTDLKDEWSFFRMLPLSGYELNYTPSLWDGIVESNCNCYAYAINNQIKDNGAIWYKQQPGEYADIVLDDLDYNSPGNSFINAVSSDFSEYNLIHSENLVFISVGRYATCPSGTYKVALVFQPGIDYHWYRQDSNGLWSHKRGITPVTRTDNDGNLIIDPQTANRGGYTEFIGYFAVTPWNNYASVYSNLVSQIEVEARTQENYIITSDQFNKIHIGMTYNQITEILGDAGVDVGSGAILYKYKLYDGQTILLNYCKNIDGELVLLNIIFN